jgi:Arc/MetJ-type ribon-helix-helix transcriptional regulator
MAIITIRVDEETRRRMKEFRHINWSSVIREAIKRRLEEEAGRNLAKAVLITERLRTKAPEGWDSTEVIRYWRSRR